MSDQTLSAAASGNTRNYEVKLSRDWLTRSGFWFGMGCLQAWGLCVVIGVAASLAASYLGVLKADDTDKSIAERSGMSLKTDYGTGCQYLVVGGAMTPRLDTQGLPVCGGAR